MAKDTGETPVDVFDELLAEWHEAVLELQQVTCEYGEYGVSTLAFCRDEYLRRFMLARARAVESHL